MEDDEKMDLKPPDAVGVEIASVLLGEIEQGGVVDSTHQVCGWTNVTASQALYF